MSRRSRRSRRRSRRRPGRFGGRLRYLRYNRRVRLGLWFGAGALVLLTAGWLIVTALLVRAQLSKLEDRLAEVQGAVSAGHLAQAQQLAAGIPDIGQRAHSLTTGPVWAVGAKIPYLGRPLKVTRGTTEVAAQVGSDAIPQLIRVSALVNPQRLRAAGSTFRIGNLVRARPELQQASATLDDAYARISALPTSTWLQPVDTRRLLLQNQLHLIRGYVDAADRAAKVVPDMLGEHGTRRYFIGLQNEAESRGTGGLPGAFAIAETHDGTIRFTRFASDSELLPAARKDLIPTGLDFGSQYDRLYGASQPTASFQDSNVSPHFPYTAQIWAAMWTKVSGQRIDGVLALDPTVLSYFLAVTGPAPVVGGDIRYSNVVALTQHDEYAAFHDNAQRKAFLVGILRAAAHRVTSGAGNAVRLVEAASRSARERRLLVWTRDPATERLLRQTRYAGAIPDSDRPFAAPILNNAASGKLDYYVQRSLSYVRTGCGPTRDVLATITLRNAAPASGLPLYVTTRFDHPPAGARPGDTRSLLDYFATRGATLSSVTVNGKRSTASALEDRGHPIFRLDLELPRGTTTVVLHLQEPAGTGTPLIWRQPGVTPLAVQETNQTCG